MLRELRTKLIAVAVGLIAAAIAIVAISVGLDGSGEAAPAATEIVLPGAFEPPAAESP